MTWEDDLAREMSLAERRATQRATDIARAIAARDVKIVDLWRLIDMVIERVNAHVAPGSRRFHSEQTADPPSKAVFYGGRRLLFEVEALAYNTWRNEPAFCPGGLARVFVDPPARDLTAFFCAISDEGTRWLAMPTCRPVTDETIGLLLRALLT